MNRKQVASSYLNHLEKGDIVNLLSLFTANALVDSPLYGMLPASEFYIKLNNDTENSELHLNGIFEDTNSNQLALYFTYKWSLKNEMFVEFDVVDIIEFDAKNKISKLKIIYDTVAARKLKAKLME